MYTLKLNKVVGHVHVNSKIEVACPGTLVRSEIVALKHQSLYIFAKKIPKRGYCCWICNSAP